MGHRLRALWLPFTLPWPETGVRARPELPVLPLPLERMS